MTAAPGQCYFYKTSGFIVSLDHISIGPGPLTVC